MTLEEYLEGKKWIRRDIQRKKAKIRFFQEKAVNVTARYSDTSGCSETRNVHSMEDAVLDVNELEAQIRSDLEKLRELDAAFLRELKGMDNPMLAMVLELKYVYDGSWREVAQSTQYSVRQLHRLQKEAAAYLREKNTGNP